MGQSLSRVLAVSHIFHSTQAKHYIVYEIVYEQMLNQASVNNISRVTQRVVLKIKLTKCNSEAHSTCSTHILNYKLLHTDYPKLMLVGSNSDTIKVDRGGKTKPLNNSYSSSMTHLI